MASEDDPFSPAHVLVVEDESLVRMMVVDMLVEAGFLVSEAPHAVCGLHAV